ncbi:NLR family CARD domain-containing protein 3-like [Pocillopora verrucosa]|uniref:NLR family CARD domain-containing protein 3-like n=1 Tax=Pocillopora verrucosa TaxID=203993 RepID=UPI003340BCA2
MEIRCYCDNLWEIVGFTEEDAEDFIFKYFRNMEHLAERLLEEIRSRSDLRQRTSNPLNTALWCIRCEDFKEAFPESRIQLYIEIVKCVLRRYEEKKGFSSNNEDLIEVCEEELRSLGRIALQFLLKGELYIEDSKTNANDLNAVKKFGLNGLRASFKKVRRIIKLAFCLIEECGKCNKSLQSQVLHEFGAHLKLEFCTLEMIPRLDFFLEGPSCNTFLTGLDLIPLTNTEIGASGAAYLSQALSVNTTLTHLNLDNNKIYDSGAADLSQALSVNTTLTYLNLTNTEIGASGAAYLSQALSVNSSLTDLNLWLNNIGASGADSLSHALSVNSSLTNLNLGGNKIEDSGAASLSRALSVNAKLTHVDLGFNWIGASGAASLSLVFSVKSSLTYLNLTNNKIGPSGAASLSAALSVNQSLTNLNLGGNKIDDSGAAFLSHALSVNQSLTNLNLCGNKIGDSGAASLSQALSVNTKLTDLNLDWNQIGDSGTVSLSLRPFQFVLY